MLSYLWFFLLGCASGSILYSYYIPKLLLGVDTVAQSDDHNPGTANVFRLAGFFPGVSCLILDLAKGFLPTFFAMRALGAEDPLFGLVLAAPVLGHAFSPLRGGRGGKAIAVSFGTLLGLLPAYTIVFVLAAVLAFFTFILAIDPMNARIIVCFALFAGYAVFRAWPAPLLIGVLILSVAVIVKHLRGCAWRTFSFSVPCAHIFSKT